MNSKIDKMDIGEPTAGWICIALGISWWRHYSPRDRSRQFPIALSIGII